MSITIQNFPFFGLIWVGIGFALIVVGLLLIASHKETEHHYIEFSHEKLRQAQSQEVEELFAYFLEEEQKKNEDLRELLLDVVDQTKIKNTSSIKQKENHQTHTHLKENSSDEINHFNQIIDLYKQGIGAEEIAKTLKKGVGEVNLMISLYTMR